MTPEGRVKQEIKELLLEFGLVLAGSPKNKWPRAARGWYYMPVQNGMGVTGIGDFVGHYYSAFFMIEAKGPGGTQSENQKRRQEEIEASGGTYLLVDRAAPVRRWLKGVSYGQQSLHEGV